ncbi:protein-S-isoprenylcysteine O-methyltransferase Ste14 [Rhizobium sp. BK251]|nr:protein-S-isoprenylcysteine O-methyltransferase Ste14 [Rhizobium sp. BK251]
MQAGPDDLGKRAAWATLKFMAFLAVLLFACAGTLAWWQGWLFLANFCGWSIATTLYFYRHDRALLERRMRVGPTAEREPAQKRIQLFNVLVMMVLFVVSALDRRFGWSDVPWVAVIAGNLLIAIAFLGFFVVLRQNSFASATVQIVEGQRVISDGLYGIVRHPMYAAAFPLAVGLPLALGSWWGLVGVPLFVAGLVARLLDEEKHLARDLPGYAEYRSRVRYRLFPGLW